jgi:hypothetical protein
VAQFKPRFLYPSAASCIRLRISNGPQIRLQLALPDLAAVPASVSPRLRLSGTLLKNPGWSQLVRNTGSNWLPGPGVLQDSILGGWPAARALDGAWRAGLSPGGKGERVDEFFNQFCAFILVLLGWLFPSFSPFALFFAIFDLPFFLSPRPPPPLSLLGFKDMEGLQSLNLCIHLRIG